MGSLHTTDAADASTAVAEDSTLGARRAKVGFGLCVALAFAIACVNDLVLPHVAHPAHGVPSLPPGIDNAMLCKLESDVMPAAISFDKIASTSISQRWHKIDMALSEMQGSGSAQFNHDLAQLRRSYVAGSDDEWDYVTNCALRHGTSEEASGPDCSIDIRLLMAKKFKMSVRRTSEALCAAKLLDGCGRCPSLPGSKLAAPPPLDTHSLPSISGSPDDVQALKGRLHELVEAIHDGATNQSYKQRFQLEYAGIANDSNQLQQRFQQLVADTDQTPVWTGQADNFVDGPMELSNDLTTATIAIVTGGLSGVAGKLAASERGLALISEACTVFPVTCPELVVASVSVGVLGFAALCLAEEAQTPYTPPDPSAVQKFDSFFTDADYCEVAAERNMADLDSITNIAFVSAADRPHAAASSIAMLNAVQTHLSCVVDDLGQMMSLGTQLANHDDANIRIWDSCWFLFCGDRPPRIVPARVRDLTLTLKMILDDFIGSAAVVNSCSQSYITNVNAGCGVMMVLNYTSDLQTQFRSIDVDWREYKKVLCSYHKWTVCTTDSVMAELKTFHQHSSQQRPVWSARPGSSPALCAVALAVGCVAAVFYLVARSTRQKGSDSSAREPLLPA